MTHPREPDILAWHAKRDEHDTRAGRVDLRDDIIFFPRAEKPMSGARDVQVRTIAFGI